MEASAPSGDDQLAQALRALADTQRELEVERRRRAESESLFDLVLAGVPDAVVLVDRQGRVTHANEVAERLTGHRLAALVDRPVEDVFGAGAPTTPWEVFQRAADGRLDLESSVRPVDGEPVPVRLSCTLLRDTEGTMIGAVYAARDVSETRHLVSQLEQAEARWRVVAQLGDLLGRQLEPHESLEETCRWLSRATDAGVAVILSPGLTVHRVVTWPRSGPAAERLAALTFQPIERGSALYTAVHGSQTVHVPTLQPDFPLLAPSIGVPEGMGSAVIVPLAARNTVLGALLVYTPSPGGIRQRALVEQAAARVALALANSQLRHAVSRFEAAQVAARFREELMAGVSHDMQTPLAVLLGSIRALQSGEDLSAEERARLYERMGRRGVQLRRLVQQFLDYSRLGAGRPIVVRPALTDVAAAIADVEADVAGRRPVRVDVPPDLPPAFVDPDRLDQVLSNLVSNAVKFSPPGSPIYLGARANEREVDIVVADRGRGMSKLDLVNVFEKFRRGSGAVGTTGSGLGLYVSRAIVEASNGTLRAASRLGEGSRFTVTLPRHPPTEERRGDATAG